MPADATVSGERLRSVLQPSGFRRSVQAFLNERRYLKNVTGDTIEWYDTAWKAFQRTLNKTAPPITKTSPDVLEGLKDLDDASVVLVFRRHHAAGYAFQALVLLMS